MFFDYFVYLLCFLFWIVYVWFVLVETTCFKRSKWIKNQSDELKFWLQFSPDRWQTKSVVDRSTFFSKIIFFHFRFNLSTLRQIDELFWLFFSSRTFARDYLSLSKKSEFTVRFIGVFKNHLLFNLLTCWISWKETHRFVCAWRRKMVSMSWKIIVWMSIHLTKSYNQSPLKNWLLFLINY